MSPAQTTCVRWTTGVQGKAIRAAGGNKPVALHPGFFFMPQSIGSAVSMKFEVSIVDGSRSGVSVCLRCILWAFELVEKRYHLDTDTRSQNAAHKHKEAPCTLHSRHNTQTNTLVHILDINSLGLPERTPDLLDSLRSKNNRHRFSGKNHASFLRYFRTYHD